MATSKSCNSATFKDTCTLFAPNWGFSGSANRTVSFKFTPTDPCCHSNQPLLFEHKIGYNSECVGDTTPIPALNRGLSGSGNLTVQLKFVPHQPLLPWQRKLAITRPVWEIRLQFLHGTKRKENSASSYAPRITRQNSH